MIPGLAMLSDELAMSITCFLCLGTGIMIGMLIMLLKETGEEDK